jgi:hypothetical protein
MGKDSDTSREEQCDLLDQPLDTDRLVMSPVLANMEWAWMVVSKGVSWYTRQAATGRKCFVGSSILANREMALMMALYKAN